MYNSAHHNYYHIDVKPVSGALGAEINGVDISLPLDAEVVSEIRKALLNHLVIFFQNQLITPQQQLNFAELFGIPMEYPQLKGLPECPLVTEVIKLEHEKLNFGGVWHSDTTYLQQPPMASILYAIEIPPYGGDTLFSNQYMAFDTLSEGLKKVLSELVAANTSSKKEVSMTRDERMREAGMELNILSALHPAVRTHPETGIKALYVNKAHTTHFEDWTEEESKSLLEFLFHHQVREELTCRFRWEKNSLAFWDNRCVQHYPINDYQGFRRIMHRVTIAGDEPY